jgi:hypothetical protein
LDSMPTFSGLPASVLSYAFSKRYSKTTPNV